MGKWMKLREALSNTDYGKGISHRHCGFFLPYSYCVSFSPIGESQLEPAGEQA